MNNLVHVTIEGISPLLMHRFPTEPIKNPEKLPPEEQAELAAYRMAPGGPEANLCIPGVAIQRALVAGAVYSKGKGRASLQKPVAACVLIPQVECDLGTNVYTLDCRPVTNPATKGKFLRYRPALPSWRTSFDCFYDPELLTADELRQVVDDTGLKVGLLDFRPACKGPFGRFRVVGWDICRD